MGKISSDKKVNLVNKNEFEWIVWTILALENWILDFGRPIAMVYITFKASLDLNFLIKF